MSIFSHFKPISTALLPNAELDDIRLVLKLFLPYGWGRWRNGKEIGELENKFSQHFSAQQAISFSSGRVGLYAILQSLQRLSFQKGQEGQSLAISGGEIILQAYTTIALPLMIKKAGFIPVYVDIEEGAFNIDSEKIEAKITKNTRAIIVQHTFGIPAEMDRITELCKKHNLFLIEDCAHSLGAEYTPSNSSPQSDSEQAGQAAKKIGTFGDAAFFSFGRDKIISSTSGGMVIAGDEKLAGRIREFQGSLEFPSVKWIFRQLMHPIVFWFSLPVYYFLNIGKLKIFFNQKLGIISRAYSPEEKNGSDVKFIGYKLPNALAILALNQFGKLEQFNDHRRKIAEIYEKEFHYDNINYRSEIKNNKDNQGAVKIPLVLKKSKPVFLYYTIQAERRDELLKFAAKKHIILGDWFPSALGPKGVDEEKFGYKKGECLIAERVGLKSLNLPTNIKTSEADARKVIKAIKEFFEEK